jgi:Zn-dependent protease
MSNIQLWIVRVPVILFAITIHEYAHGWMANRLGDPTAKMSGRLTLNPVSHIDLFGALCFFIAGFGWAKPVPVDPRNFRNPRKDELYVSLAGPFANLFAALTFGLILRHVPVYDALLSGLLVLGIFLNTAFAVFNLLPVFPLDGSHVLKGLLSPAAAAKYSQYDRYSMTILILVILSDNFMHLGILNFFLLTPITYLCYLFGGKQLLLLMGLAF